jgi:pantetheine-phosphate adenylyltransferase
MRKKISRALYAGTFDPVTFGHIDLIRRALQVFDEVVVAVAQDNSEKSPLFSLAERLCFLKTATRGLRGVSVESFEGLVVEYARRKKAKTIIRGIRMLSDFEYEFQMALTNRKLADDVETFFLMPHESYAYLSSRLIKQIASLGGDVRAFVPRFVLEAFKNKFHEDRTQ